MAQHKQAEKRHRQSLRRRERNQHFKSMMRTYLKRARQAIESSPATADEAIRTAMSVIDRVAQKGIIPAATAARKISRLMKARERGSK